MSSMEPDHLATQTLRSFVFLQGPTSGVFRDLGRALAARGHRVVKVNLCVGDWLFWHGSDTRFFRGTIAEWEGWLEDLVQRQEATDIIYFADRFPYHKAAQRVAHAAGLRCISMEYGYLRPDWIILESGGQSTYSHLSNDPETYRNLTLPTIDERPQHGIPALPEAICETAFHLSNALLGWLTPRYQPNRYYPELTEFLSYVPRLVRRSLNATKAEQCVAALMNMEGPVFLAPLQMQNDYQLRDNAPPGFQTGFIQKVLASFAQHAAPDAQLVFKLHPMDNGLERWERRIPAMARSAGVAERVHVLDGGDLTALFARATGCVVINSTMGLRALRAHVPTIAVGVAVYDIDGLTHQGPLATFWTDARSPDAHLLSAFVRALAHGIHVRGAVYGASGRAAFVANAIRRLEGAEFVFPGLSADIPPRLEHARRLGIKVDWHGTPEPSA